MKMKEREPVMFYITTTVWQKTRIYSRKSDHFIDKLHMGYDNRLSQKQKSKGKERDFSENYGQYLSQAYFLYFRKKIVPNKKSLYFNATNDFQRTYLADNKIKEKGKKIHCSGNVQKKNYKVTNFLTLT